MEVLGTIVRSGHYKPASRIYKSDHIPTLNHKRKLHNFKADVKSDYFSALEECLYVATLIESESAFNSKGNKARIKVLKMRLKTLLIALIGTGIPVPVPEEKNIKVHLEKAISTYRFLAVRATSKMKNDFFNSLMAARKLL